MNGLLTGLLARRETGLIEEIEKLERRITDMENQANEGMWIAGDDMQLAQYTANKKRIPLIPLNENSEALAAVRILRYRGFSREQIEKEWKRQESQDKKSELAIEFFHILQNKGIDYSIGGENIAVHGTLDLIGTNITSLPDNLSVGGGLDLSSTSITSLPDNLSVGGRLDLSYTNITRLPENLSVVGGSLDLSHTNITSLPKNLSVGGGLYLCYTGISNLPDNLSVRGWLDLENTCITRLPNNLKVGGFIYLHPEKITNIAYRKFLRDGDYTVFAAWINGECCVVVNSIIYTLEEFLCGSPTADVAQAARECVAELTQRWKTGGAA